MTAEDQALLPGLGDEEAIEGLIGMARDEDPEMRLQALAMLSQGAQGSEADKASVQSAIDAALTDQDARVRGQAFQALASRGGAEAMWHLRQALRDPDPGVRILAIENAGSGEQGKALLEEALSDQDEVVRAVARARLEPDGIEGGPSLTVDGAEMGRLEGAARYRGDGVSQCTALQDNLWVVASL
ncbi:MAG: HEAT repeat domain-containing protein [Gammaproteobacteria bacterium]